MSKIVDRICYNTGMIKKYLDKYLDKAVDEGTKTLKRARLTLLLIGIGVLVFFVGILGVIIYLVVRFI